MKYFRLLALLLAPIAIACSAGDSSKGSPGPNRLLVVAAADLRAAFEEIGPEFEKSCDCEVEFSFGSSGMFAAQIAEGLPADVFFSADMSYIETLDSKRAIISETKQPYAVGRIVLASHKGSGLTLSALQDLLAPRVSRVAIANPDHAPYGVAAKEALESAGVWELVQPKLILGENAAQTTQFVSTANVAAGIVPLSLAIRDETLKYAPIDDSLYTPLEQGAAVLMSTRNQPLAVRFLQFVNGTEGSRIMSRYGFLPPE